jgi:hypothetical protein
VHEADETARTVAALLDLAAVGVEDAITEIALRGSGSGRLLDQQDLVAADAEMAIRKLPQALGTKVEALAHAVEDDEIVAQSVHFGKAEFHEAACRRKGR